MKTASKKKNIYRPPEELRQKKSEEYGRKKAAMYRIRPVESERSAPGGEHADFAPPETSGENLTKGDLDRLVYGEVLRGRAVTDLNMQKLDYYGMPEVQKELRDGAGEQEITEIIDSRAAVRDAKTGIFERLKIREEKAGQEEFLPGDSPFSFSRLLIAGVGFLVMCALITLLVIVVNMLF